MVAAGVLGLIFKEGTELPAAAWVAMGVGFGLAAISGFTGEGTSGGSGLDADGDGDGDGDEDWIS
jgi:hypothetical protein